MNPFRDPKGGKEDVTSGAMQLISDWEEMFPEDVLVQSNFIIAQSIDKLQKSKKVCPPMEIFTEY